MTCKVGYPEKPCPFGFEGGRVTRKSCGACKNFIPPRHILTWCQLWDRDRVLCMKPISACETCPEKMVMPQGRPAGEGRDMADPKVRREYEREYRKKNPEKIAEIVERFKEKNPTYWRDYMRARRQKQREQGGAEVRADAQGLRSERDEDLHAKGPADGNGPSGPQRSAVSVPGEHGKKGVG